MESTEQSVTDHTATIEAGAAPVLAPTAAPAVASTRSKSAAPKVAVAAKRPEVGPNHVALERLLAMAKRYRKEGQVREAMEMFWELAESHSDTTQGDAAKELLLEMAAGYERDGSPRLARSIYERILDSEE